MKVKVGDLTFEFPKEWSVERYDEWSFYNSQFQKIRSSMKGLDLLAWEPEESTLWLIEVKDYRQSRRTKPISFEEEVTQKVIDTLSGLLPCSANANIATEKAFANKILSAKALRVVLHLEQPKHPSKLNPMNLNLADLRQKLRVCVKPVDPHPVVADIGHLKAVKWKVS